MSQKPRAYLFVVDPWQAEHVKMIRSAFAGHKIFLFSQKLSSLAELTAFISKAERERGVEIKGILLSYTSLLKGLIRENFSAEMNKLGKAEAISTNYQGARFYKTIGKTEYPVVILPELKSFVYKKTGIFLAKRYFAKLHDPKFPSAPELLWEVLDESNADRLYEMFKSAILMGGDLETTLNEVPHAIQYEEEYNGMWLETYKRGKEGNKGKELITSIPRITMHGWTGIFKTEDGKFESYTIVIPLNDFFGLKWLRKFNLLPAPKIYQNGKYDIAYLLRFGSPIYNYKYDTLFMMHAWYAELPKNLNFISSFALRNHMYWKDENNETPEFYNAQDCHYMTWACAFMLQEMPDWAKENYVENFQTLFPAISANLHGVLVDKETLKENLETAKEDLLVAEKRLSTATQTPHINGSSSPQMVTLMSILGFNTKKSDKAAMTAFRDSHELNSIFAKMIDAVREKKKAIGNYFQPTLFNGRYLSSVDPAGTETGRCAARESEFWCGGNLQNQPFYAKNQYIPDDGWLFGAKDYAQSESRCTAYMSEDEALIDAVENSVDFHVRNAASFFGIEEDLLLEMKTTMPERFKIYRNKIGKRINHGANYNMGDGVLLQNMGAKAVIEAGRAIGTPSYWSLRKICAHLLSLFDKAYPMIRNLENPDSYYSKVIKSIEEDNLLVGPTGWTRYCFGSPRENKLDLNSYVAHGPQSLSVKKINKAWREGWKKLQIKENKVRFLPQIHDELWFMYKKEDEDYVFSVLKEIMEEPTVVNGRTMIIPTDDAKGAKTWAECK